MKLTLLFLANFPSDLAKLTNRISRQPAFLDPARLPHAGAARSPTPAEHPRGRGTMPRKAWCRLIRNCGTVQTGKTPQPGRTECRKPLSCSRNQPRISAPGFISELRCGPTSRQQARRGRFQGHRVAFLALDRLGGAEMPRKPQSAVSGASRGIRKHYLFSAYPRPARGGTFAISQTLITDHISLKTGCRPQIAFDVVRAGGSGRVLRDRKRRRAHRARCAPHRFPSSCPVSVPCQCQC